MCVVCMHICVGICMHTHIYMCVSACTHMCVCMCVSLGLNYCMQSPEWQLLEKLSEIFHWALDKNTHQGKLCMFGNWDLFGVPPPVPHVTAALWSCARWHHSHQGNGLPVSFLRTLSWHPQWSGQWNLTQSDIQNQAQAPGAGQHVGALLELWFPDTDPPGVVPMLWSLLLSSNTCVGSPFAWLLGIHTRGMVPPWSCPRWWENSTPTESFVTELSRRQVQRQLPAQSAHHCNATRLVVTTNNSALPGSQLQGKAWPELPRFIPETPYFMEKDPEAQAVQMNFQICQKEQSVGSSPGPGHWSPVSLPWPLPSPFYFVVEIQAEAENEDPWEETCWVSFANFHVTDPLAWAGHFKLFAPWPP